MRKFVLPCVAAALMTCGLAGAQPKAAVQPELPESVCALVEIGSVSEMWAHLGQFIAEVSPGTQMPPVEMVLSQLTKAGNPLLVDASAPLHVVVLKPPALGPAIVFSVTDAEEYFEAVPQDFTFKEKQGDLRFYEVAVPLGAAKTVAIGAVGTRIVVSQNPAAAQAVVDLIKSGALPAKALLGHADVALFLNIQRLLGGIEQMLMGNPFDMLKMMAAGALSAGMTAPGAPMGGPQAMKALLAAEIEALEKLVRQAATVQVTLSFGPQAVRITERVQVVAGGAFATYIASIPKGKLRMLKYLPTDSMVVWVGKVGDLTPAAQWYGDLLGKVAAAGQQDVDLGPLAKTIQDFLALCGDEMCYSMSAGVDGSLSVVEAVNVKDPVAVENLYATLDSQLSELLKLYKQMGLDLEVKYTPKATVHNGHNIAEWRFSIKFQPAPAMPDQATAIEMQQKLLERMFGGPEITMHSTFLGKDWIMAGGKGSLELLKKVMDGKIASIAASQGLAAALGGSADDATSVCQFSLARYLNWYLDLLAPMIQEAGEGPLGSLLPLGQLRFKAGPGIAYKSRWSGTTIEYDLSVPSAEMRNIVEPIQTMMMGMMQEAQ